MLPSIKDQFDKKICVNDSNKKEVHFKSLKQIISLKDLSRIDEVVLRNKIQKTIAENLKNINLVNVQFSVVQIINNSNSDIVFFIRIHYQEGD